MCILNGHQTYSLRRHYPVTGSAVDAAKSPPASGTCPTCLPGTEVQRPLSPVLRAPALCKVPPR
ncbi:hypothetical protein SLNWT_3701 [Streptomyces albus]|uniref:Uncharacterized protein n=1 Tax=Streptomyces albus (strain ATCC 21838 / DSM 41398 / FERM P-419 / JCM 4703 / NBRC 107858) TaxID=1081613 RepID=A0A0B5F173_STRA4|nr:hypothetical protein SLNWT_3701 [Streptomyces albus]AOU78382.1 hypothetical protein SLNHY_3691 [Streptomyces albus]AYN34132.1 hypothetical protein DUI70_3632 [Streptomyces albus]